MMTKRYVIKMDYNALVMLALTDVKVDIELARVYRMIICTNREYECNISPCILPVDY